MKAVRAIQAILIAIPLVVLAGSANAANVIQDGAFRRSIGIGFNPSTPWNDWTGAGISNSHTAPVSIPGPGNYASIPVGGVLFQRFGTLSNGTYTLSFLVQNQSPWSAQLVFAVQQALGTPVSVVFAAGTGGLLDLPPSSSFLRKTLTFSIGQQPFAANELYFSNSYNSPEPVIANSKNRAGTIINIADVSIVADVSIAPVPNAASSQNAPAAIPNASAQNAPIPKVDPNDVVAQVLNFSAFGKDDGFYGTGWRKDGTDPCQYRLFNARDNPTSRTIDLNMLDPQNISFGYQSYTRCVDCGAVEIDPPSWGGPAPQMPQPYTETRVRTVIQHADEVLFATEGQLSLERLQRGWELIYRKYCTGKRKQF